MKFCEYYLNLYMLFVFLLQQIVMDLSKLAPASSDYVYNPLLKRSGINYRDGNIYLILRNLGMSHNSYDVIENYTRSTYCHKAFMDRMSHYVRNKPVRFRMTSLFHQSRVFAAKKFFPYPKDYADRVSDFSEVKLRLTSSAGPGYPPGYTKEMARDDALSKILLLKEQFPDASKIPLEYFESTTLPVIPRCGPSDVLSPKARPVIMDPLMFVIIEGVLEQPLSTHLREISRDGDNCISYGLTHERLAKRIKRFSPRYDSSRGTWTPTLEVDFSKFDSIMKQRQEAMFYLQAYYDSILNPTEIETWSYQFSQRRNQARIPIQFGSTRVLTHDISISGRVYTSFYASIVNLARQRFLYLQQCRESNHTPDDNTYRISVLGDDSIQSHSMSLYMTEESCKRHLRTVFQSECPKVTVVTHLNPQEITFLGHQIRGDSISRSSREVMSILLFPERDPTRFQDHLALTYLRAVALNEDSGRSNYIIVAIVKYLEEACPDIIERAKTLSSDHPDMHGRPDFLFKTE